MNASALYADNKRLTAARAALTLLSPRVRISNCARDRGKCLVKLNAEIAERDDYGNRRERGDHTVFHGGNRALIPNERRNESLHGRAYSIRWCCNTLRRAGRTTA